jgi:hypothetical protein
MPLLTLADFEQLDMLQPVPIGTVKNQSWVNLILDCANVDQLRPSSFSQISLLTLNFLNMIFL